MTHAQGVIHRDIKPSNVLMTTDGVPKLTDFGLARQESSDEGQTREGTLLGTLDYMPPEQRKDATSADVRSDLWSLGATFYQMVTGNSPRVIVLEEVPGVRVTVQWSVAIQKLTTRPRAGPGDRGLADAATSDPRGNPGDAQCDRVSQSAARSLKHYRRASC